MSRNRNPAKAKHTHESSHSPYPSIYPGQHLPIPPVKKNAYRNDDILLQAGLQHLQLIIPRPVHRRLPLSNRPSNPGANLPSARATDGTCHLGCQQQEDNIYMYGYMCISHANMIRLSQK